MKRIIFADLCLPNNLVHLIDIDLASVYCYKALNSIVLSTQIRVLKIRLIRVPIKKHADETDCFRGFAPA
jgi:hypothetical protein